MLKWIWYYLNFHYHPFSEIVSDAFTQNYSILGVQYLNDICIEVTIFLIVTRNQKSLYIQIIGTQNCLYHNREVGIGIKIIVKYTSLV